MGLAKEKLGEARKGDGVLLLMQNNASRAITISSANDVISNLLGYAEGDLVNHSLEEILGARTKKLLEEELAYTEESPDFGDIFSRQPNLRLRHRLGEEVMLSCTVMRVVAEDRNPRFQLVLPDERETRSQNQLREFLKTNLESRQQLDPVIGVPDRATTENYLSMLRNYLATHEMAASFAILRLDRHDRSVARYGAEACQILLKHVANCCRSTFRTEDMIGVLSDHTLGLVLFDISRESARLVLNRLRWNIRNHRLTFGGKDDFSITVSIAFDMINEAEDEDILLRCENGIERLDKDERNSLTELGG